MIHGHGMLSDFMNFFFVPCKVDLLILLHTRFQRSGVSWHGVKTVAIYFLFFYFPICIPIWSLGRCYGFIASRKRLGSPVHVGLWFCLLDMTGDYWDGGEVTMYKSRILFDSCGRSTRMDSAEVRMAAG